MTTTTIGARRRAIALLVAPLAFAAGKKPKPKQLRSVIAGTVFRDPGFAVPGAEIEMIEIRTDGKKGKPFKTVTDGRGEFAFTVPPVESKYRVKATAKGLQTEEKETISSPGVRMDVFFSLKPIAN
jgi:hypothetical protein